MEIDVSMVLVFGYLVSLVVATMTIYFLLQSLKQKTTFAGTKLEFAGQVLTQITSGLKTKFNDAISTAVSFVTC